MKAHDYQYDINTLLQKDGDGLVSSFLLQLDSILLESDMTSPTEQKLVDELIRFLHDLSGTTVDDSHDSYVEGYREGYGDCENGDTPEY